MSAIEHNQCNVKADGYLESGCEAIRNTVQHRPTKKSKGLFARTIVNVETGEKKGTMVSLHSGDYVDDGILLNFCPFCGSKMHDLFKDNDDEH